MSASRSAFRRDLARWVGSGHPIAPARATKLVIANPGVQAALLYRIQVAVQATGRHGLARAVSLLNLRLTGAEFVVGCRIGPGLVMRHPQGIVIGNGAIVGRDCTLLHRVTLGERYGDGSDVSHAYPTLGDRVVVGAGAAILGRVHIGDDVAIGANAVVLRDVASNDVSVGVPAHSVGQSRRVVVARGSQVRPDTKGDRDT
jgi:serine O-acetyltransferase